jgi:sensor domain CHASE-containing protein
MTVRAKALLTIGITLACTVATLYLAAQHYVADMFLRAEQATVRKDVQRALSVLEGELTAMGRSASDWAAWDDAYQFMGDHNKAFVESNFTDAPFTNLHLSALVFVSCGGRVVLGNGYDLLRGRREPLAAGLLDALDQMAYSSR